MKKQYILPLVFLINILAAMDDPSLFGIFQIRPRYAQLASDVGTYLASHVTSHQWWYPQKELQSANTSNEKQKITPIVVFSPSGHKIAVGHPDKISIYQAENATLEATFPENDISVLVFNKDETKIWGTGKNGRIFCADIKEKKVNYTVAEGSIEDLWENVEINDEGTEAIMGGWCKSVLIDTATGKVKKQLWQHYDQKNNDTICAHFIKNTSEVHVFHNGFLDGHMSNKIVMVQDNIMIWNLYQPTLKQLLLKRLLTLWWQVKRQFYGFTSPELWLNDVSQLFSLDKTKASELKQDLLATWNSFPQYMQDVMSNTLKQKIKQLRSICNRGWIRELRNKKNDSPLLQPACAYIPSYSKRKRKNK